MESELRKIRAGSESIEQELFRFMKQHLDMKTQLKDAFTKIKKEMRTIRPTSNLSAMTPNGHNMKLPSISERDEKNLTERTADPYATTEKLDEFKKEINEYLEWKDAHQQKQLMGLGREIDLFNKTLFESQVARLQSIKGELKSESDQLPEMVYEHRKLMDKIGTTSNAFLALAVQRDDAKI